MADKKSVKVWEPNNTQKDFMNTLKDYSDGATLKDIELDTGKVFKTGAINVLVSKGLVVASDGEFSIDLVYRETTIGSVKKSWKIYRLA